MQNKFHIPNRFFYLLSLIIILTIPSTVKGQRISFDASSEPKGANGYHAYWDSVDQRMIWYRDVDDPSLPAVQVTPTDGSKVSLYPLKDFAGASYIDIWDATASPNGETVIAAILAYGPRNTRPVPVKSLLLTYDATGTLRKVWDVDPYHHHHVATDASGNVYALGDGVNPKADFPLVVKYSPTGKVLQQFLSSGLFAKKDDVVGSNSPNGESQIFVRNDHVFVWIAMTLELFDFSLDGSLLSRTSLSPAIQKISDAAGGAAVGILSLTTDSNRAIIAQLRIRSNDGKQSSSNVGLARISQDGNFQDWIEPVKGGDVHHFLGLQGGDKPVFLEKTSAHSVIIDLGK